MDDREKLRYQLHGRLPIFHRRLEHARRWIRWGLARMEAPYVSVSFGKDSTVMLHLLWSEHPEIPAFYVNCGTWDEWPDTSRVKQEFLTLFPDAPFVELHGPSIMEFYRQAGFYVQDEEGTIAQRQAQRDYGASLCDVLDGEAKGRGLDGAFMGVRADESDNRQRLFAMRGPLYFAATRDMWACHPLARWTAADVWAYIVMHGLPYNDLYDLAPEGRERARNGAMFGSRSARYGRLVFLKQMYPEWFNRFAAEFPEARAFV